MSHNRNMTEANLAQLILNRDRDPIERARHVADKDRSVSTSGRTSESLGRVSPYRSKLEEAFAYRLVLEKRTGIIIDYWYEPTNLRLPGEKNFYKCDFLVLDANGLTFYEIKGKNKSDDRSLVKTKTAAGVHTWAKFVLVKRENGIWVERTIE